MTDAHIQRAYATRASEYTALLGSVESMHELDRQRIKRWAAPISGRILDAGCGPGHWTDFLHQQGADMLGIDLVPEFIQGARLRFPDVSFQVSTLNDLQYAEASLGGVLAWYSLIHVPPTELPAVLLELARVLSPKGHLLIGFFDGPDTEPFDHAVTTAYYWSVKRVGELLADAGFELVDIEQRQDPGARAHAAIHAIVR